MNLQLSQSCCIKLSTRLELRANDGYNCNSVLTKSEQWMEQYQPRYIIPSTVSYRDVMDWALCMVYPETYQDCMDYYNGTGKQLRFIMVPAEIFRIDTGIFSCLSGCYENKVSIHGVDLRTWSKENLFHCYSVWRNSK